jgi:hypothetical protein
MMNHLLSCQIESRLTVNTQCHDDISLFNSDIKLMELVGIEMDPESV